MLCYLKGEINDDKKSFFVTKSEIRVLMCQWNILKSCCKCFADSFGFAANPADSSRGSKGQSGSFHLWRPPVGVQISLIKTTHFWKSSKHLEMFSYSLDDLMILTFIRIWSSPLSWCFLRRSLVGVVDRSL